MGRWTCNICTAWCEPYISVEPRWGTSEASIAAFQRVMEHAVRCYNKAHPPAIADHSSILPSFSSFMPLFLSLSFKQSLQWQSGQEQRADSCWMGWLRCLDKKGWFMHAQLRGKGLHGEQWRYERADERDKKEAPGNRWCFQHSVWMHSQRMAPKRNFGYLGLSNGPTAMLCWNAGDRIIDGAILETTLHPRTGDVHVDQPTLVDRCSKTRLHDYVMLRSSLSSPREFELSHHGDHSPR